MENENIQNSSGSLKAGNHQQKDIIPLWLQGLKEHEDEDTRPLEVEEAFVDSWVASITEEAKEAQDAGIDQPLAIKDESTGGIKTKPGFLDESAEIDQHDEEPFPMQVDLQKSSSALTDEHQEEDLIETTPEKITDEAEKPLEDLPSSEDEIPQTEPSEVEITDTIEENTVEELSQDEDLPPWLQEMIAEPQPSLDDQRPVQEEPIHLETAEKIDEPTEPIVLSGELSDLEKVKKPEENDFIFTEAIEEEDDEIFAKDTLSPENEFSNVQDLQEYTAEPEDQPIKELEEYDTGFQPEPPPSEWVPEQVAVEPTGNEPEPSPTDTLASSEEATTSPLDIAEESSEVNPPALEEGVFSTPESLQEKQGLAEAMFPSLSEELRKAKEMLLNGETNEAVHLVRNLDERSTYRQEIKTWLIDAVNKIENPSVGFWELLGDIALEDGQPDMAFDAYARAIQSLLINQEECDEFNQHL